MRSLSVLLLAAVVAAPALGEAPSAYKLIKTVKIPGDGGWDYLTVDEAGRRVYISHGNQVDVLDADTLELKGKVSDTQGVHGIAVAPELGHGYTSNGRADTVTVFDLKTLKTVATVKTGKNPDAIIYDPATKQVFAFNGRDGSATAIDAVKDTVAGTITLGGKPEFAAADGMGHVFVNIEDKSELVRIDAKTLKVLDHWPLAPGEEAVSMAIDPANHRVFVGCHNKKLVVVNSDNGKVVADLPIGRGVDASAFDPKTKQIFSSNGDGTVTVIHQDGADKYRVEATIKTQARSRTMTLDPKTHRLFLPGAEFKAADGGNARQRPTMVPGSFAVLVFGM